MAHVVEDLPDLLGGALPGALAATVRDHLACCPECAGILADFVEVYGMLALARPPEAPSPEVRARVIAAAAHGRLHRFAGHVSALFHVDDAQARALLDELDQDGAWEPAILEGSFHRVVDVQEDRIAFFIRVPAGEQVPLHEHHGREQTLVLQGRLVDDAGGVWLPGEEMPKEDGTRHSFRADGGLDLLCGVVVEGGVSLVF